MRENTRVLNSRETNAILDLLKAQWGYGRKLPFALLQSNADRLYGITLDFARVDPKTVNIDAAGLYFGELRNGELRLSIEGSQLIGPHAQTNIVELSTTQMRQWLKGEDLAWTGEQRGFVLLRCGADFLGSGKYKVDAGVILNFVPKARRILAD